MHGLLVEFTRFPAVVFMGISGNLIVCLQYGVQYEPVLEFFSYETLAWGGSF
jgi:hypothetical protein